MVAHGLRICMSLAAQQAEAESQPRGRVVKADLGRRMGKSVAVEVEVVKDEDAGKEKEKGKGKKKKRAVEVVAAEESVGPVVAAEPIDPQLIARLREAAAWRQASAAVLSGVGKRTAEKLAARGLETVEDLAYLLPLGYEDRRATTWLQDVEEGATVVVDGVIRSFRAGWFSGRYSATMRVEQTQKNGARLGLEARWFHPVGGLGQRVSTGDPVLLAGVIKHFRGKLSMVHPEVLDAEIGLGIALRYPVVEGVGQRTLARMCRAAVERLAAGEHIDPLPEELVRRHQLIDVIAALELLHAPPEDIGEAELAALLRRDSPAHRRLAFDEFFFLQLALLRQRGVYRATPCALPPLVEGSFDRERLRVCLPWEPTAAQWRVIGEIERDLGRPKPMLRLLQGDVGSGKTAVAFASALAVIDAGAQAAIMAPTEILAEQHLRSMEPWCERAGLRIALLTGSTPRAQRTSTLALLAAGELDLLVGTHALLVEDVAFANLALVVVDEQHRFGVEQRGALRSKGAAPHLLVMTATPIPRSLALTAFGELDVSVIDELPPGRVSPTTQIHAGARALARARRALVERVQAGDKAYVVCPLVEASEAVEASDVEATAAALRKLLPKHEIGVVHGRMVSREKDAIMQRFRSGELRVLVATTVIEVGVDVPDARVILIEHAERFGLAQLHQLRGRVGRSAGRSLCLLHTASDDNSDAGARLEVLARSGDGFVVAERDLELRGPGELFGTKQSGVPRLRFASFSGEGMKMLVAAREAALEIIDADPTLRRHPRLRLELELRTGDAQLWAGESG
ncbi:MAG: ATP-dependent DNA helicase RecG [Myxococcales bacterium]|nr:ATP-dependent DNA helicase RecG [Myxococcales bacterium]